MFTPDPLSVLFGYLVGLLCVLVPLFFAVTAPTVFRARRKRRLPTPQSRQREDALPVVTEYAGDNVWGHPRSRGSN